MVTNRINSFAALTLLVIVLSLAAVSASTPQSPPAVKDDDKKKAVTPPAALEWTALDKAVAKASGEKKAVLIDVYTDWCGWCKKMDKEVFVDPAVAGVLSSKFALAKVNGESKEEFTFKGKKTDGIGIARAFGVRGYPAIIFLDSKGETLTMIPGFLDAEQFLPVVLFIGNREYEKMEWADYLASYTKSKKPVDGPK
jgi:thioredoxin-related protein